MTAPWKNNGGDGGNTGGNTGDGGNGGTSGDTGSTSTGSSDTSSSSSSSSSAPSAPPDPLAGLNSIQRQKYSVLSSAYTQLWGEVPDPDVIKKAMAAGLNVWQFSLQQRLDQAWLTTKAFRDKENDWASLLKNLGAAG